MIKFFCVVMLMVAVACTTPSEIGADFISDESIDINYSDTLSVRLSTVVYDSMVTSNATRLLVGYYNDEFLGKVKSSAVFQLLSQPLVPLDETTVFDQLTLHVKWDGYSYYDTLNGITLAVYQLENDLELNDSYLYSTSAFTRGEFPIGSISIMPEPHFLDSLDIPLSTTLGSELFKKALNSDASITEEFTDYINGIAIVPDESRQSCFLGISKEDVALRLYYYDYSLIPATRKYIDFSLGSVYFNQIQSDRSTTILERLSDSENELSSVQTSNMTFIQSGLGVYTKVDFPFLQEFGHLSNNLVIVNATLQLTPSYYSKDNNTTPPSTLSAYIINGAYEIQSQLSSTAYLKGDEILERGISYSLDVTEYVKSMIANQSSGYSLLVMPDEEELNCSVNKVSLGSSTPEYLTELKIAYLKIN